MKNANTGIPPAGNEPDPNAPPTTQPDTGFGRFLDDTNFLHKIKNPDFPHKGAGVHVPLWVHPNLATKLMALHGRSGHVIPHPDIAMMNTRK
jgi:hypothetical protein